MRKHAAPLMLLVLGTLLLPLSSLWAHDWSRRGLEHLQEQNYEEAIDAFSWAIAEAYNKRAVAWSQRGDFDKSIADSTRAVEIAPRCAECFNSRGIAWHQKGNFPQAIEDYTRALEIHPGYDEAYNNRGSARANNGQFDLAIEDYTKAIEINDRYAQAYKNRGTAWAHEGDFDRAVADYTISLDIDPSYAWAYNQLAWLYATCPDQNFRDGTKAVEMAEKAIALSENPEFLDTLAAAYAEAGRFDAAVDTQKRAVALFGASENHRDLDEYRTRLDAYQSHQPWRETFQVSSAKQQPAQVPETAPSDRALLAASLDEETEAPPSPESPTSMAADVDSEGPAPLPFSIQVCSLRHQKNAIKVASELTARGQSAFVSPSIAQGKRAWYRVLVGSFATSEKAKQAVAALKAAQYSDAFVVNRPYIVGIRPTGTPHDSKDLEGALRSKGYFPYHRHSPKAQDVFLVIGAYRNEKEAKPVAQRLLDEGFTAEVLRR